MLTEEERYKRDKLVKDRPCKECMHYRKNQYISCDFKCDNSHSGFKRLRPDTSKG